jgi:hypothetical protein
MAYNANMLNILNDQNETRPKKLALMDIGAIFTQSSFWDGNWRNPRLDSGTGFHSQNNRGGVDHWCMIELPKVMDVHQLIMMKRGDNTCRDRLILRVEIEYSEKSGSADWVKYKNGEALPTG